MGIAAALAAVAAWVTSHFTLEIAKAVFEKAILYLLFTVVLPIVLWNLLGKVLEYFMGRVQSVIEAGGDPPSMVYQATGLLAWVLDQCYFPQCIALIVSAVALRWVLNVMTLRP